MTDPIADMLARIRNAISVRQTSVDVPYSKMKFLIAQLLEREGWIAGVEHRADALGTFRIALRYDSAGIPAIRGLRRVSRPGQRRYVGKVDLPIVLDGMGMAVVSTSSGLMTAREARRKGLGGEVVCEIT